MADSSSHQRPRYVPGRQRRKQQQRRFHGAFTGGFSAGFFNTVGSKEGWKPRKEEDEDDEAAGNEEEIAARPFIRSEEPSFSKKRPRSRPEQKLEDFMDEQDHDEWGGPTSIRKEYNDPTAKTTTNNIGPATTNRSSNNNKEATIEEWMKVTVEPPVNVGLRLLRILGWRESSSAAYVREEKDTGGGQPGQATLQGSADMPQESKVVLTKKRLRKVQLQQQRVKIPPPKLDTCGLGFEPYQNAPEFKAYQDRRRKLAQQRAKLGHGSNVYRVSNVMENDADEGGEKDSNNKPQHQKHNNDDPDDVYVSYETVEDFIGQKSVGGFALREDDDDAYDDEPTSLTKGSNKVRLDTEEYNDVVYEHSSDDDGDNVNRHGNSAPFKKMGAATNTTKTTSAKSSDLAGILSTFADTDPAKPSSNNEGTNSAKATGGGVTADGRPPLTGFVLGGGNTSHSIPKRYRGPDVPLSYQVERHQFGQDEHPLVLKALSRAMQLEAVDEKRRQAMDEALRANASSHTPSNKLYLSQNGNNGQIVQQASKTPMAGGAFQGLAEAMKTRFTSSSTTEGTDANTVETGIRLSTKGGVERSTNIDTSASHQSTKNDEKSTAPATPEIKITRTVRPFAPHRLLCKRFHVPVPASSMHTSTDQSGNGRVTEASYFAQEILNTATAAKQAETQNQKDKANEPTTTQSTFFDKDGAVLEEIPKDSVPEEERPAMEIYKSIFEPQSEEEEEDDEDNDSGPDDDEKDDSGVANEGQVSSIVANTEQDHDVSKATSSTGDIDVNDSNLGGANEIAASTLVVYDERDKKKKKKRKKHKSKKRERERKAHRHDSDDEKNTSDSNNSKESEKRRRRRRKRSRSVSSHKSDLSEGTSSVDEKDRKRRRDRKDKKKHKRKKKSSK